MNPNPKLPDLGSKPNWEKIGLVPWENPASLEWLSRTLANKPFTKLARFYEAQADKFMCGPASVAMVLNCIKFSSKEAPVDDQHESFARALCGSLPEYYMASFQRYTQRNIFCGQTSSVKSIEEVYGQPGALGEC